MKEENLGHYRANGDGDVAMGPVSRKQGANSATDRRAETGHRGGTRTVFELPVQVV